jgi:hypothetical protein
MKIKKNTFSTFVLELFSPSIANCRKLKIQKNQKIDFPYYPMIKNLKPNLFFISLGRHGDLVIDIHVLNNMKISIQAIRET